MILNNINNIIITTGGERLSKIEAYYTKNNMKYILANSIVPNKGSNYYNCSVINRGNAGLSIGHIKALEIASELDIPSNIFEDDEILHDNYVEKRNKLLLELQDWDFINLNTLRPTGNNYSSSFKKICKTHKKYNHNYFVNNIWLSNYCITPSFAKICLDMIVFDRNPIIWKRGSAKTLADICNCFAQDVYDQFFILSISNIANKYNLYVTKQQNQISHHSEIDSIRKKYN